MNFGFINVALLNPYSYNRRASKTQCGRLQGGKCNNTYIFILCRVHSTVKMIHVLVNIPEF